jgi:hypothetical protein
MWAFHAITLKTKTAKLKVENSTREPLLKGKTQYNWPPYTNKFRLAAFAIENIIYFLTKRATLMRRSAVLSLPLKLVFSGSTQTTFRFIPTIDIERKYRLFKVCYVPTTSTAFFLSFLLRPLTVLMRQTRQMVRTINQSIFHRCLWFWLTFALPSSSEKWDHVMDKKPTIFPQKRSRKTHAENALQNQTCKLTSYGQDDIACMLASGRDGQTWKTEHVPQLPFQH